MDGLAVRPVVAAAWPGNIIIDIFVSKEKSSLHFRNSNIPGTAGLFVSTRTGKITQESAGNFHHQSLSAILNKIMSVCFL